MRFHWRLSPFISTITCEFVLRRQNHTIIKLELRDFEELSSVLNENMPDSNVLALPPCLTSAIYAEYSLVES
jgi:hypothetical protein